MGAASREYLRFEMIEEDYKQLSNQTRSKMNLLNVDVKDFDYDNDEVYIELKKVSNKAYKKLKEREYFLRHQ
jgi:CRISPR/Cas system-associated exonuclease Cas4 (RecB family)